MKATQWPPAAFLTLAAMLACMLVACSARTDHQNNPPPPVPGGDPLRGARALADYGCNSCHTIPGVESADALVGPPLDNWGDRRYIAGAMANEPQNLIYWIRFPQEVEPGTAMPDLGVEEQAARDMTAYLFTLRRAEQRGVWPFGSGNR